ncbi:hypothetical protein GDO78_003552 [Eleutherodactylus coqui]|uniref:Uncharacterized protein n=1 Tax=Eleutherodactylus coqui TaxID=57060 RepID=A0A8J6K0M7_ELECQ|nr:hypothetical protein GDO78_003552 [Eleutherodactylus coqui]
MLSAGLRDNEDWNECLSIRRQTKLPILKRAPANLVGWYQLGRVMPLSFNRYALMKSDLNRLAGGRYSKSPTCSGQLICVGAEGRDRLHPQRG